MKEGITISEVRRGLAQPGINRQEQISSMVDAKEDLARRDKMANAKEFDATNAPSVRAIKCTNLPRPGPCLGPKCATPQPCLTPRPNPKCGPNR